MSSSTPVFRIDGDPSQGICRRISLADRALNVLRTQIASHIVSRKTKLTLHYLNYNGLTIRTMKMTDKMTVDCFNQRGCNLSAKEFRKNRL